MRSHPHLDFASLFLPMIAFTSIHLPLSFFFIFFVLHYSLFPISCSFYFMSCMFVSSHFPLCSQFSLFFHIVSQTLLFLFQGLETRRAMYGSRVKIPLIFFIEEIIIFSVNMLAFLSRETEFWRDQVKSILFVYCFSQ